MAGNEDCVVSKLEYLRNEVIPFFQDNFNFFNQLLSEFMNLSVKFLTQPDFSIFRKLLNSCKSNHEELVFLLSQMQVKTLEIYQENKIKTEEKFRIFNSLGHLNTKLSNLKDVIKMVNEDELSYLSEIQNEKSENMKLFSYIKTQKKVYRNTMKKNRQHENTRAEFFENLSILKQHEKHYNKKVFEYEIKNCLLIKKIQKNFEETEEGEKDLGKFKADHEKNQTEIFEFEQNIKYLDKMIEEEEKDTKDLTWKIEKSFNKIADIAILKKKKNLSFWLDSLQESENLCTESQDRLKESIENRKNLIKDYKCRLNNQKCDKFQVLKALQSWIDFTELSKYAETVTIENNTRLEELKKIEYDKIEEQKKQIDNCFNKKKKNQRKSSVVSKKNTETQQSSEAQLNITPLIQNKGYSTKRNIDPKMYIDNFKNDYLH